MLTQTETAPPARKTSPAAEPAGNTGPGDGRCSPTPLEALQTIPCRFCAHQPAAFDPRDLGQAHGNTARWREERFTVWRCPACGTLNTLGQVCFEELYRDYPLRRRTLDYFARGTLAQLLGRLRTCGLTRSQRILDYGCGNGVFLEFLRRQGFCRVAGYDPFEPRFAAEPEADAFDAVVANDTLEHCEDPEAFLARCCASLKPGGLLYIGTAEADGLDPAELSGQLMRLHLPFHRTILTAAGLRDLGRRAGLQEVRHWRRSYMDTWRPCCNYRFLDELNGALGHVLERALSPQAGLVLLRRPWLLAYGLFGAWFPSANEPAVAWRKMA